MMMERLLAPLPRAAMVAAMAATVLMTAAQATAQPQAAALTRADFTRADTLDKIPSLPPDAYPHGFGDRQNSWAWGMEWFNGKLYVATNRSYNCMVSAAINRVFPFVQYPPNDADIECAPHPHDMGLQAEIWAWDPAADQWTRVFQSPRDLQIPQSDPLNPKFVARDVGFRGLFVRQEPDGNGGTISAMYASGVSPSWIFPPLPGARILRTTDGVNFTPVPQTPGTFLGNLGNASFRGMAEHAGKLYAVAGGIQGDGVLIESDQPWLGDNAWRIASSIKVSEISAFNGYLYLGITAPNDEGFQVARLDTSTVPYTLTTIVTHGGHRSPNPNFNIWSMKPFNGRLYVGGNGMKSFWSSDIIRINPGATAADPDTWDVVVGPTRTVPFGASGCTEAAGCVKSPLSGLSAGFGWPLNAHIWRMEVYDSRLYVGTFDLSTTWKQVPLLGALVAPAMGFDLTVTEDGEHFSGVDFTGFRQGPIDADPTTSIDGNKFNFGARTIKSTPFGLFLGTANYYYGLQVWRGVPAPVTLTTLLAPSKLMVERTPTRTLLAWERPANASRFVVFRSVRLPTDPTNGLAAANGVDLDQGTAAPFMPIGVTTTPFFADTTAGLFSYTYFVVAQSALGANSRPSNIVVSGAPAPVTFAAVVKSLTAIAARCGMSPGSLAALKAAIEQAAAAARLGDPRALVTLIRALQSDAYTGPTMLDAISKEDLLALLNRLAKRVNMARAGLLTPAEL